MGIGEIFFILIVIWTPCLLCDRWDDQETKRFVEEYIPKLQQNLRRAIEGDDDSDENHTTSKTIIKNNRRYDVHLIKLRDVNGLKRHNLIVKEKNDDNPLIYVINPVETKIPHAYVSQTEFKDILIDRVKKQRNEVYKKVGPLLPVLPVDFTYWTKATWSKPPHRSTHFRYKNFFKRRQHNTSPIVTSKNTKKPIKRKNVSKTTHKIPLIPYVDYLRKGNRKAKTHKSKVLRSNKTSKALTNETQYLRSNRTSKAISNKAITLKNNETIKAKIIYLRSNRSIITNGSKEILQNLSTKPIVLNVSNIFEKDQNINITEIISKANIIGIQNNDTIERQTTEEITTEKSTTENEIPPTKNDVTDTIEVLTTREQATEEVASEKPTTLDTKKLKETNIESSKTNTEITGDFKNAEEITKIPTYSEITIEKLTTEEINTEEPTNTETVNTEHSKEEESMATENTAETPATEDTTKYNDNTDNNTESVSTEDQEVDLATDQSKGEDTTQRKALPFRTKGVKKTTTKPRTKTKRPRLSRPLVFMGETGNGNSWN